MTTGTRIVNHDLRRLMSALGVSPDAVARQVQPRGTWARKERGVSHIRIYQLLASDAFLDRRRVLHATAEAAGWLEISPKLDAFSGIVTNIPASADMAPDAKRAAVQQAATDLAARLGAAPKAGAKGISSRNTFSSPAAAYASDLKLRPRT